METKKEETGILKPVFIPSVVVILIMVIFVVIEPKTAGEIFTHAKNFIVDKFGWFYMLSVGIFTFFVLFLALSPYGRFKLGPDQSKPAYSYTSWFAMLFSAGMGIGLMFYGVAEPVMHFIAPPVGDKGTVEAARNAMVITFFHWGLHAWAIYAAVGLVLAYFSFRHGLPLSIRSSLYPLIGKRIYGKIGHTVDTVAVLGTLFGVATSLGLGVMQVNAGFHYLFDVEISITVQIILIVAITAMATISVVTGLDAGVKILSELNLYLAVALMLFVILVGPTFLLLGSFVENIGGYLSHVVNMTFNQHIYDGKTSWMSGWTLFYWAWWIAWAPFVGMFIARVSRGRTIREFVLGVLFVPVGFTFLWMTVFGNTAIDLIMNKGYAALETAVSENVSVALFKFLEFFPFSSISSIFAVILVITFFVTSSDSGSLVIDTIASKGKVTPVWQRVFWALLEGVVAIALLAAGGLEALQSVSIMIALPFAAIMLVAVWGLYRALHLESTRYESQQHHMNAGRHGKISGTWKARLSRIVEYPSIEEARRFINEDVIDAMNTVKKELYTHHWDVQVTNDPKKAISVFTAEHSGDLDFVYAVHIKRYDTPDYAFPDSVNPTHEPKEYARAEVYLQDGNQAYDIYGYDEEVIATDIIDQFEKHRHFLHSTAGISPVIPID